MFEAFKIIAGGEDDILRMVYHLGWLVIGNIAVTTFLTCFSLYTYFEKKDTNSG